MALETIYDNTNAYTSFLGGTRSNVTHEDLLDVITNLDREMETPFVTMAPKTTARDTAHSWMTETLQATSTAGAVEGAVFSPGVLNYRTRIENICQIYSKSIQVSNTLRAINPAGVSDEYTHQIDLALQEIKRNIEASVFKIATGGVTGTSSVARELKGLRGFAGTAGVNMGAGLSTGLVLDLHQSVFQNGGSPNVMYVSPGVKRAWSALVATANAWGYRNINASENKGILAIDMFESDFGVIGVIPDRFIPQSTASSASAALFLFNKSQVRLAQLRPVKVLPMGIEGDRTGSLMVGELTLEVLHPSAVGIGTGVTA